jgi:hypothetical protein
MVLLLVVVLAVVVPVGAVILVGGVKLLLLGAAGDEVGGVAALKIVLGWSPPPFAELVQVAAKEDKANSKEDETVLVGLASWPPARAQVIKGLLVRKASWFGRPFLHNSWHLSLLNKFSVSKVAKSANSSKAVIFIPPHMIIKSVQQLFSMFIIRICKRTTRM